MRTIAAFLLLTGPALAAYPTPQEAGFHHCALIYNRANRPAEDLALYAARHVAGQPTAWLFDSFLFLVFTTPSGRSTMTDPTDQADWQAHLDQWFAPGRDLAALDQAIEQCSKTLGAPPAKRQVMLSVPRPLPQMKQFGDVDGDGVSEDLSTPAGVDRALEWFVTAGRQRFAAAGYRHLTLWGFYWMDEGVRPSDERHVQALSGICHAQGLRLLWIPWYQAPGAKAWRELGFDVAIMQPNYAFQEVHHGEIRRNRLALNADLARQWGLGVEIELPMAYTAPAADRLFYHYLREGAAERWGYQQAATAYYLGTDNVETLARSTDPRLRRIYDHLADYVAGQTIVEPDPPTLWTSAGRPLTGLDPGGRGPGVPLAEAEARFAAPRAVAELEIYLDEPDPANPWRGLVEVDLQRPGQSAWEPGGWVIRPQPTVRDGRAQVVVVPLQRLASALRVRLVTSAGPKPTITGLVPFERGPAPAEPNLALRRPYAFRPAPLAQYPDRGRELTDRVVSERGFGSGETVGWYAETVAVAFDLGAVKPVERVVAHAQGGGYGAVDWPAAALLFLSSGAVPPTQLGDQGAIPEGFAWASAAPVQVDRRRSETDLDGHLAFAPPAPVAARYLTLVLRSAGWLMLSEIEVFSGGRNLAPEASYRLSPLPTGGTAEKYAENGKRLTDGIIPDTFSSRQLTGWTGAEPREVEVDLGAVRAVREVTLWSVRCHPAGIYDLGQVEVEVSEDATTWRPAVAATRAVAPAAETGTGPLAYRAELAADARFVRVRVTAAKGWAMLSEVEVR